MSSKDWMEKAIKKPAKSEPQGPKGKRARLAETLLKMRKEKG
jgi:hypothetical protein